MVDDLSYDETAQSLNIMLDVVWGIVIYATFRHFSLLPSSGDSVGVRCRRQLRTFEPRICEVNDNKMKEYLKENMFFINPRL